MAVDDALPPEPDRRIARAMVAVWMLTGAGISVTLALVAGAVVPVLGDLGGMPGWVGPVITAAVVVTIALLVVVIPIVRYRIWRYAIRAEEIDLLHGALVRTRTVVPMARVQHVETERNFLESAFDIATVKVHTAAGTHEIPGLPDAVAAELRTEIARRARVPDEV